MIRRRWAAAIAVSVLVGALPSLPAWLPEAVAYMLPALLLLLVLAARHYPGERALITGMGRRPRRRRATSARAGGYRPRLAVIRGGVVGC